MTGTRHARHRSDSPLVHYLLPTAAVAISRHTARVQNGWRNCDHLDCTSTGRGGALRSWKSSIGSARVCRAIHKKPQPTDSESSHCLSSSTAQSSRRRSMPRPQADGLRSAAADNCASREFRVTLQFRPMPDTQVTNWRSRNLPFVQGDLSIPAIPDAKIKRFASGGRLHDHGGA